MGEFIPAFSSAVIFPTTLPLLRQAFVAIRLQGGPHAKAQRIIKTYRRNRMIVCTICALVTLASTLSVRFISQRNLNQQRVVQFANHAVEELDKVLLPLQAGSEVLLPLIGLPCSVAHLPLRKQAANSKLCDPLARARRHTSIAPAFWLSQCARRGHSG